MFIAVSGAAAAPLVIHMAAGRRRKKLCIYLLNLVERMVGRRRPFDSALSKCETLGSQS